MDQPEKLTVTVRDDQAERIREIVANGDYASADDFVTAAIENYDNLPDWLPNQETLKRSINQALDDPRPRLTGAEVQAHIEQWVADAEQRQSTKAG